MPGVPAQVQVVPHSVAKARVSPLVRKETKTPRRCIHCRDWFDSTGPGNQVCGKYRCQNYTPDEFASGHGPKKRIYSGADMEAD